MEVYRYGPQDSEKAQAPELTILHEVFPELTRQQQVRFYARESYASPFRFFGDKEFEGYQQHEPIKPDTPSPTDTATPTPQPQQQGVGEWKYESGKWYSRMKMWDEIQNEPNPTRKLHLLDVYERKYGKASSMLKGSLGIPGFQTGGKVHGYGGGDRVPAFLEKGEFVIRKEVAREYEDELEGLNRGNFVLDGAGKNHYRLGILLNKGEVYGRISGEVDGRTNRETNLQRIPNKNEQNAIRTGRKPGGSMVEDIRGILAQPSAIRITDKGKTQEVNGGRERVDYHVGGRSNVSGSRIRTRDNYEIERIQSEYGGVTKLSRTFIK